MEAFAIPFLLFVGALLAVQAAANVQLSTATGSPFGASTLQLGIGATLLLAVAASRVARRVRRLDRAEPWPLIGGLGSAVYITSGILLFPRLGAVPRSASGSRARCSPRWSLTASAGWGSTPSHSARRELTRRTRGADRRGADRPGPGRGGRRRGLRMRGGWLALAVLAGAALPVQGAINAELRSELDATIAVGALSFLVATAGMALLLAASLSIADAPRPRVEPLRRMPWWGWLGGLAGATTLRPSSR